MCFEIVRRMFSATWFDALGRAERSATYGTNGDAALADYDPGSGSTTYADCRTNSKPAVNSHDDVIVSTYAYDGFGRQYLATDNRGKQTKTFYDSIGQVEYVVENYITGGTYWTDSAAGPAGGIVSHTTSTDINRITESWDSDLIRSLGTRLLHCQDSGWFSFLLELLWQCSCQKRSKSHRQT